MKPLKVTFEDILHPFFQFYLARFITNPHWDSGCRLV